VIPSAEKVLGDYLRDNLSVDVVSRTPDDTSDPWARITLLGNPTVDRDRSDHLIEAVLQIDCFAGEATGGQSSQSEAEQMSLETRELLRTMSETTHDDAVVTGAVVTGTFRDPDPDFEPARERYVMTTTVWMHNK